MSETHPFLFGKLPTFGDFLNRGLAGRGVDAWDRRCTATLRETGARVAPPLYTDALGPKGSAGDTYLKALRANVAAMVGALK